jgi:hypothetical protein
MVNRWKFVVLGGVAVLTLSQVGCGTQSVTTTASLSASSTATIHGTVYGGQQPVTGSTIQLWQVGTTGDASSAMPMLTKNVTTAAGTGSFSLYQAYTCPANNPQVYITAVGGNPGLGTGNSNPQLALMAVLGPCSSITSNTTIDINELTTIASVIPLTSFMKVASSYTAIGSGTSDAGTLAYQLGKVAEYTNVSSGTVPGSTLPSGYYGSSLEIASLANALVTCVNSTGGTAGDGSACGTLFSNTTVNNVVPTDTIGATLSILQNPTNNVCAIFYMASPEPPFQPTDTLCPSTWLMPIEPIAATPAILPSSTTLSGSTPIYITDSTSGSTVIYTTDGTTPSISNGNACTPSATVACFTLSSAATVKAIAVKSGYESSGWVATGVASSSYTYTAAAPSAPTGVIASAAVGGVNLVWQASPGATSYNVYRYALTPQVFFNTSGLTTSTSGLTNVGSTTATSFSDQTATLGIDYLYVVTALNSGGESAVSDHSCGSSVASGTTVPVVRPRVFMAAHGTNLSEDPAGMIAPYQDPTAAQVAASSNVSTANPSGIPPLINYTNPTVVSPLTQWAYVQTCLDGIWSNYALDQPEGAPSTDTVDEVALWNLVNTRNVLAEEDLLTSPATLVTPTSILAGPQSSATPSSTNIVQNREGVSIYIPTPSIWDSVTMQSADALYITSTTYPAWSEYNQVYYGTSIREWASPLSSGQIFSDPNSTAAFQASQGVFTECGTTSCEGEGSNNGNCSMSSCQATTYRQGYINALVATHLNGGKYITFYSVPGNSNGLGTITTGWLNDMQETFNFALHMQCSGTYDPSTGNYYPYGGYYLSGGTYQAYSSSEITSGPTVTTWSTCQNGATYGLFQQNDVVMVINYHGYYPPTPEYKTNPVSGKVGKPADSVTGMLNWLLHQ